MEKQVSVHEREIWVVLIGAIHTEDAELIRPELLGYVAQGYNQFVIDMSQVDYIDSAGIAAFIALHKGVARSGGGVTLKHLKGVVRELFEMTQLGDVFRIQE